MFSALMTQALDLRIVYRNASVKCNSLKCYFIISNEAGTLTFFVASKNVTLHVAK